MTETPNQDDPFRGKSAEHHMLVGSVWMVAMRWAIRLLGLASSLILARLLMPEDFGVVAIAVITAKLVEAAGETSIMQAIIRHPNPTREHYNTAWTIGLIAGIVICLVIILLAPFAAYLANEPRAELPIQILALRAIFMGTENIGIADFLRNLDYGREFRFRVYQKVIAAVITVGLAVIWRDYWALIIGLLIGTAFVNILGYWMSPYRPWFSLSKWREIWGFSVWMLGYNYAIFLLTKLDEMVVIAFYDARRVGYYTFGSEIGTFVSTEMINPMTRSLYPVFSKLIDRPAELTAKFLQSFGVVAVIVCSTSVGLAIVAEDMVLVALGEKWLPIAPLIPWLAFAGAFQMMSYINSIVFQAMGQPRTSSFIQIGTLLVMLALLPLGATYAGLEGVAATRALIMALSMPIWFWMISRLLPLHMVELVGLLWRPVAASALMAFVLLYLMPGADGLGIEDRFSAAGIHLLLDTVAGATVFTAGMLGLWSLAGRPPGIERFMLRAMRTRSFSLS